MNNEKQANSLPLLDNAISLAAAACIAALGWWAFTLELPEPQNGASLAPRPLLECMMGEPGYLRGALYSGQNKTEIDWSGKELRCDGMYRPEGTGVRMVFDQHLDKDKPGLILVLGVADAMLNETVTDATANITLIDQTAGKFYSTGEQSRCWTSFNEQQELSGTAEEVWRINGIIYCEGPLNELRGKSRIRLGEMEFSGLFRPGMDN